MDNYITGAAIKSLREAIGMTQSALAERIGVSDKAVSKWETGRGLPDITLIEPLARALHVSVPELISGEQIKNRNRSSNMLRAKFYVCPVCGNVIHSAGEAAISCCGIALPALEAEPADDGHLADISPVEDEQFISVRHPMTKEHYLSFLAYTTTDRAEIVRLYPEGGCETRFRPRGEGVLYLYCNRHGLKKQDFCALL